MEFEILKSEGLGRIGYVCGKQKFTTPELITTKFFNGMDKESFLHDNTYRSTYNPDSNNSAFVLTKENKDLQSLPSLIIYPSLQMQCKSLNDISNSIDLFPSLANLNPDYDNLYHLIPWDLPLVHLNEYDKYLSLINGLEQSELVNKLNLVLNIPCTHEIFELKLSDIEVPAIKGVCLGDISSLLNHPTLLLQYLNFIRLWASPNVLLYAPGIPSSYIPLLVYLGIDLFDLNYLKMVSINSSHQSSIILEYDATKDTYVKVLQQTKLALKNGNLRDLARIYANSYPPMKALLRIADSKANLINSTPIYGSRFLYCTDKTDFTRPEVSRFRKRVRDRYIPPQSHLGILFLPCSAKKPYSKSKSHKLFMHSIRRGLKKKRHFIGEVILTSPLSVVPRDLEYTYPAAHYDIPVTGEWSEIEKNHLREDLSDLLQKLDPSIPLVGHLNGIERVILKEVCETNERRLYLNPDEISPLTSRNTLKTLSGTLRDVFEDISPSSKIPSQLTFLRIIADYQFGKGAGLALLPDDVRITGYKELGLRVKYNNTHLLTFRPEIGLLTISLCAGRRLLGHTKNVVVFHGKQISGSTIFAKGIIDAHSEIHPNEEVLIVDSEGQLMATGTSYLSGEALVKMNRGKGIKIRKKVK